MYVYDYYSIFSVICIAYISIVIAICTAFFFRKKVVQIQIPDFLFIGYFLFVAFKSNVNLSISQLGDITLLLLYLCIRQMFSFNYHLLYKFVLVCSLILSLLGYLQYANLLPFPYEVHQVTGPFYNPAPYGALLSIFASVIIIVVMQHEKKVYFKMSLFVLLFLLYPLILSGSRAAWLALFVTVVLFILARYKSKLLRMSLCGRKLSMVVLFIGLVSFCMFLYYIRPDSAKGRLLIWKISLEMIEDAPLTGHGYNSFESCYMKYQSEYFKQEKGNKTERYLAGNIITAYNEPLRIMVEHGVLAFILWNLLIYIIIFRRKQHGIADEANKAAILVYIIFSLFSYPNRIFSLQLFFVISLACLVNEYKGTAYCWRINSLTRTGIRAFFLLSVFLLPYVIKLHIAYHRYYSLLKVPSEKIIFEMQELEPVLYNDVLFLQNYCVIAYGKVDNEILLEKLDRAIQLSPSTILYRMKGDCLCEIGEYQAAEAAYWMAHYMVPSQQLARYKLILLYLRQGRKEDAKEIAFQVLQEKPKNDGIDTYILRKKIKEIFSHL